MKEGLIKDIYEIIIKEIQTVLTFAYLVLVGIGMIFTYYKYAQFGINIFDYADIFEFLIAPFSDPKIILFAVLTFIFVVVLLKFDDFLKRKYPKMYSRMNWGRDKKSWFGTYRYISFALLFVIYLFISAAIYSKATAKELRNGNITTITYTNNDVVKGIIIGKTNNILFILQGKKIKAIPLNTSVKEFEIK
jgi:ABC-type Fe3+ transport system permease subunit